MQVKIVRDSMNRMLELWKDIPAALDGDSNALPASQSQSNPSPRGDELVFSSPPPPPNFTSLYLSIYSHIFQVGN